MSGPSITEDLRRRAREAAARQGWLGCRSMLAAYSGGGDSAAVLALVRDICVGDVAAAHVEHGLRGASSIEDERFAREWCEANGIRYHSLSADIPSSIQRGESDEMAGRRIRYRFFDDLMDRYGYEFTATGHNADDTVETVLLNLFRGTGVRGLAGIPERRGRYVRPAIGMSRRELREMLIERGIPWREDETNSSTDYKRNLIRLELLPWVRSNINSSPERAILDLAAECARRAEEDDRAGAEAMASISVPAEDLAMLAEWASGAARSLSADRLALAVREQGNRLGLAVLDRRRCAELVSLMLTADDIKRFQWCRDIECVITPRRIFWASRGDIPDILKRLKGDRQ